MAYSGPKRYVRLIATVSGATTGAVYGVVYVGEASSLPVR